MLSSYSISSSTRHPRPEETSKTQSLDIQGPKNAGCAPESFHPPAIQSSHFTGRLFRPRWRLAQHRAQDYAKPYIHLASEPTTTTGQRPAFLVRDTWWASRPLLSRPAHRVHYAIRMPCREVARSSCWHSNFRREAAPFRCLAWHEAGGHTQALLPRTACGFRSRVS